MLAQPKVARVLFDESHSEAWTIRRDLAERDAARPPGGLLLRDRRRARWPPATSRSSPNADRPLDAARRSRAPTSLVIAHPSDPKWEATVSSRPPDSPTRELDAIEEFVRGGGGLIVLGETEQDKYGNNLNDLLARFGIEVENATVQDYEHHHDAPPRGCSRTRRRLANDRDGASDARPTARTGRPPRPRRTRPASTAPARSPPHNGGRVIARTFPTASRPGAPLAAVAEHGAGRVVVLADSDLFGDDCIGELDNEPLWLNLVYWAAQPAFAGVPRPSPTRRPPPTRPGPRSSDAVEELRAHPGARRLGRHRRARRRPPAPSWSSDDRRSRAGLAPPLPAPAATTSTPSRADLRAWADGGFAQARLRPLDRGLPPGARPPRRHRAPGRLPDVQAERLPRHLLRGADRPRPVAGLRRRARALRLRQPQVRPGQLRRLHRRATTPSARSSSRRPSPPPSARPSHFGGIFCDREAERFRRVCGGAAELLRPQPAARRRLPADLAGALRWTPTSSGT